mgnify:CR=1 FL=1
MDIQTVNENAAPARRWLYNIATLVIYIPLIINTFRIFQGKWYEHVGLGICGLCITALTFKSMQRDKRVHLQKKIYAINRFLLIGALFIFAYVIASFFGLGPRLIWLSGLGDVVARFFLFIIYAIGFFGAILILDSGSKESGVASTFLVSDNTRYISKQQ